MFWDDFFPPASVEIGIYTNPEPYTRQTPGMVSHASGQQAAQVRLS